MHTLLLGPVIPMEDMCLTPGDTLNGVSASERHCQPGELGRSSADATGGMDRDPGHVPVQDTMSQ